MDSYEDEKDKDDKLLWTKKEAARQLSVSVKTISRLIADGVIPIIRWRRRVYIEKQSIRHFIAQHRQYNSKCVELVSSLTGENKCNSISERASTKSPSNWEDARLDALLKPVVNR